MFYYLYQITNKTNGKIYVGVHKTSDMGDGYMGSGKLIRLAIRKYGVENFEKTILQMFTSTEETYLTEAEIVNVEFVNRTDTYNMACGGSGGTIEQNRKSFAGKHHSDATKKKISELSKGRTHSLATRESLKQNNWARREPDRQRAHASQAGKQRWEQLPVGSALREDSIQKISSSVIARNEQRKADGIPHPVAGVVREKIKCPHCDIEGAKNTMIRWHFDNCKKHMEKVA